MKKKLFLALISALTALVLAGCVRMDINVTINRDGTVDLSMLEAVSDALNSFSEDYHNGMLDEEQIAEYEAEGAVCTPYYEDGYTGYTISEAGIPISDLLTDSEGSDELGGLADSFSLTRESGAYILDISLFSDMDEETLSYLSSVKAFGGYMTFTLTLPTEPIAHNADGVSEDGLTLTWDLTRMSADDTIHVEFKMPSPNLVPAVIGISAAIVVIAAAAVLILVLAKKRKKKAAAPQYDEAPSFGASSPSGGPAPGAIFCPKCGTPSAGRFCPRCGNDLSQFL